MIPSNAPLLVDTQQRGALVALFHDAIPGLRVLLVAQGGMQAPAQGEPCGLVGDIQSTNFHGHG
jgi:hypothetical protein